MIKSIASMICLLFVFEISFVWEEPANPFVHALVSSTVQNHEDNVNAFQTKQSLDAWNKAHHAHLVSDGKTVVVPLGIYSK